MCTGYVAPRMCSFFASRSRLGKKCILLLRFQIPKPALLPQTFGGGAGRRRLCPPGRHTGEEL